MEGSLRGYSLIPRPIPSFSATGNGPGGQGYTMVTQGDVFKGNRFYVATHKLSFLAVVSVHSDCCIVLGQDLCTAD